MTRAPAVLCRFIWLLWLSVAAMPAFAQTQVPPGVTNPAVTGVPVVFRGQEITRFFRPVGMLSPAERARIAERRIGEYIADATAGPADLTVVHLPSTSEIIWGDRALIVIAHADAEAVGQRGEAYAEAVLARVRRVAAVTRAEFTTRAIAIGVGQALAWSLALLLAAYLTVRAGRAVSRRLDAWREAGRAHDAVESVTRVTGISPISVLAQVVRIAQALALTILALIWVDSVLEALPWTAPSAVVLRREVAEPLYFVWNGFLAFVPNALFLGVIAIATRLVLRVTHWVFRGLELGLVSFESFPPEWAEPTYKVVRVLVLALGLVAAFPYIPGSGSPAFQGISLFLGLLVSLSSSSAISNIIAGTVLTYTRAFRLSDVVRIGGTFGQVVGKSLLVTNVRTIENVSVSIPNAVVLSAEILNYTTLAAGSGLVLATEVSIGYDVPWRTVRALLLQAALKTPGVLPQPEPVVRQKSLDDFYVTYRLNATTREPGRMMQIYSDLHAAILDEFNAAGVEILSPHYRANRDGSPSTIPAAGESVRSQPT